MQPYFIPYIGYWQLMNAVDKYVVYDDVNYIKGGWINRNRILMNGKPSYFNIPTIGASPNKLINEVCVNNDKRLTNKNLRIIEAAYKKAPQFETIYPLVQEILEYDCTNIADYIFHSFTVINRYLDIKTELIMSSSLHKDNSLHGQDKVIAICKELNATEYYNAIGGQTLYSFEEFSKNKVQLKFLQTNDIFYKQFDNIYIGSLSIIDVLMFNNKDIVQQFLNEYSLIERSI